MLLFSRLNIGRITTLVLSVRLSANSRKKALKTTLVSTIAEELLGANRIPQTRRCNLYFGKRLNFSGT